MPGTLPGGASPAAPRGGGFPLARRCLQGQVGAPAGAASAGKAAAVPEGSGARRGSRAGTGKAAPGRRSRTLPRNRAGRGFPVPRPRPGGPARPRASAQPGPTPARILPSDASVSAFGCWGGGTRTLRRGPPLQGRRLEPPGLVCDAPPPMSAPSSRRSRAGPVARRLPCRHPGGFPRPAPRRGHPRACTCASLACAAAAQPGGPPGEPGGAGAAPAAVRGQVPSTCRCPVCSRQGEPASKPLLPEQTAGPGQGTAEYS